MFAVFRIFARRISGEWEADAVQIHFWLTLIDFEWVNMAFGSLRGERPTNRKTITGVQTIATGQNDLSFNRLTHFRNEKWTQSEWEREKKRNFSACMPLAMRYGFSLQKHRFDLFTPSERAQQPYACAVSQLHLTFQLFDVLNTHYGRVVAVFRSFARWMAIHCRRRNSTHFSGVAINK